LLTLLIFEKDPFTSFPWATHASYCATLQNQRKTAQTRGKTVDYPLVSPSVAYRKIFTGGTATGQ
jgi:hypothetical protein